MTMQLIGWTLVHSLWEGGLIALVLAVAFSATRSSNASLRYIIGMVGLGLMVALPIATTARMNTQRPSTESATIVSPLVPVWLSPRSDAEPSSSEIVGSNITISGGKVSDFRSS